MATIVYCTREFSLNVGPFSLTPLTYPISCRAKTDAELDLVTEIRLNVADGVVPQEPVLVILMSTTDNLGGVTSNPGDYSFIDGMAVTLATNPGDGDVALTITGVPTVPGVYRFRVRVEDNEPEVPEDQLAVEQDFTFRVMAVGYNGDDGGDIGTGGNDQTVIELPPAQLNAEYPQNALTKAIALGAPGTPQFSATGLPAGMFINSATGAIYGTPTVAGSYNIVVKVEALV